MRDVKNFEAGKTDSVFISYRIWEKIEEDDVISGMDVYRRFEGGVYQLKWHMQFDSAREAAHQAELWMLKEYLIEGVILEQSRTNWLAVIHNKTYNTKTA